MVSKRVLFKRGKQKEFLEQTKNSLKISWEEFAKKLRVKKGTLEKSYRFEYCNLPLKSLIKISKIVNMNPSSILSKYSASVMDFGDLMSKQMSKSRLKLSPIKQLYAKNILLDSSELNYSSSDKNKAIKFPDKLSPLLAEEIGMNYGDGFLSSKKYEYRLKGNKNNEREYYDNYIKKLFKRLYNLNLNIKEYETTYGFELYSKAFWEFKTKILGIKAGKKTKLKVPDFIKNGNQMIITSFIKGLFDTDGSVSFLNKYNKGNYYPLISLASVSKELIDDVYFMLGKLSLNPKKYCFKNKTWQIQLAGYERFKRYNELVGWSNQKNLNKIKNWDGLYGGRSIVVSMQDKTEMFPECGANRGNPETRVQSPATTL